MVDITIGNFHLSWGKKSSTGETYDLKGTHVTENLVGYHDDFSNERVSETRALGLATVWTCINVRSRTIASLPINIIREEGENKQALIDHPAYYILAHQPNNYMSSAQMFITSMIHSDGWGNSIIGINRDGFLRPISFDLVQPGEWSVYLADGQAFYKINGLEYAARDVLHFRWFSLNGLIGISAIRQNAITMGKKFKQERYSAYALGKKPPGYLSNPVPLSPPVQEQNKQNWQKALVSGDTPALVGDWKFNTTMINPGDAEYVATANLTDREIYGIFQLPPSFAQNYDRMTWSNAEQADLVYAKHTVTPIVRVIEQECNMKLFTEVEKRNTYVKFNMNGLLRGDLKARAEFYTAMRNMGAKNANEIRSLEDDNPYQGGEIYTVQSANIPVDQLREFYTNKVAPTAPPIQKMNGVHHVN